jgi:hypothetical protein
MTLTPPLTKDDLMGKQGIIDRGIAKLRDLRISDEIITEMLRVGRTRISDVAHSRPAHHAFGCPAELAQVMKSYLLCGTDIAEFSVGHSPYAPKNRFLTRGAVSYFPRDLVFLPLPRLMDEVMTVKHSKSRRNDAIWHEKVDTNHFRHKRTSKWSDRMRVSFPSNRELTRDSRKRGRERFSDHLGPFLSP